VWDKKDSKGLGLIEGFECGLGIAGIFYSNVRKFGPKIIQCVNQILGGVEK
jgi:hypothetical protein